MILLYVHIVCVGLKLVRLLPCVCEQTGCAILVQEEHQSVLWQKNFLLTQIFGLLSNVTGMTIEETIFGERVYIRINETLCKKYRKKILGYRHVVVCGVNCGIGSFCTCILCLRISCPQDLLAKKG